jgi:hypothetical protein
MKHCPSSNHAFEQEEVVFIFTDEDTLYVDLEEEETLKEIGEKVNDALQQPQSERWPEAMRPLFNQYPALDRNAPRGCNCGVCNAIDQ